MEWNETTYTENQISDMKREAENKIKEMHSMSKSNPIINKNKRPKNSRIPNSPNNSRPKIPTQHSSVYPQKVLQNNISETTSNMDFSLGPASSNNPRLFDKNTFKIPIINKEFNKDSIIILALILTLINGECDDNFIILALMYILLF